MARVISFGDDGEIEVDRPKVGSRFVVRFPSEAEQKRGMTEVPQHMRIKRVKRGNKK